MKRRRVIWSVDAIDELIEITEYISEDNPQASRKVARVIRAKAALLGETATGRRGRVFGTYEKSLHPLPYIIVYAFRHSSDGVEALTIVRVIHMARD